MNGAGEMLVFSAADFEDFLEPRPDLPQSLEAELTEVVTLLARDRWPFRLHATYDESITRFLNVFEAVNRDVPFEGLRWFFDHAETISERNIEGVRALGGGIAVQDRMAFQGEYFIDRYGKQAAEDSPPIRRMLEMGVPVGAGTDATRVSSYNPWLSLYWLVAGKTVGGTVLYPKANRLERKEALRRYTVGSAWFSGEENKKGTIEVGKLADLAVLSADYFSVPEEEIKGIESLLTIVGGNIVYGAGEFARLAPPSLPVSPGWSPAGIYGGYHQAQPAIAHKCAHPSLLHQLLHAFADKTRVLGTRRRPVGLPCECFAF
jgi:predicted amidohydrolase YtcJ